MKAEHEPVVILDYGSQYSHLIARRVRELQVYSQVVSHRVSAAELRRRLPKGLILSGGPASVLDPHAPTCEPEIFSLGVPVLGICYGMQLMAHLLGGRVRPGAAGEFGLASLHVVDPDRLFAGLGQELPVWMSHGDHVTEVPPGFRVLARTDLCAVAAMADPNRHLYGLQFHPEVTHTPRGAEVLRRFLFDICHCTGDWRMAAFVEETVAMLRERIGNDRVLCALSGGVDSSVVAALLHRAVSSALHCLFVDNGLLRDGEADEVERVFRQDLQIPVRRVQAAEAFFSALRGVTDPEAKRRIIGKTFIDIFAAATRPLGPVRFLAQGTLYPDVIESASPSQGPSATIKSHHNVGGLPPDLQFELIEPLRDLFKDEVRQVGRELGLPETLLERQPFPGPGLAVRILGEVTPERVRLLQQADRRVTEELRKLPNYRDIWQGFAVLLPVQTVGVMGDARTYENVVAVRVVESRDGMTADWFRVPYDTLAAISNRIINEVRGINRVVFDISSKPPATIEWE